MLTPGGVYQLIESEGHFSGRHEPTLQIINIRRVPANALTDVYWVSLRCLFCDSFAFNLIMSDTPFIDVVFSGSTVR